MRNKYMVGEVVEHTIYSKRDWDNRRHLQWRLYLVLKELFSCLKYICPKPSVNYKSPGLRDTQGLFSCLSPGGFTGQGDHGILKLNTDSTVDENQVSHASYRNVLTADRKPHQTDRFPATFQ